MTKWEYFVYDAIYPEKHLNELGESGWELVTVVIVPGEKSYPALFFKRPILVEGSKND